MKLKLLIISPPGMYSNECSLVCRMFAKGLKKYHLRKPGWPEGKIKKLISEFPAGYRKRIVIHSHYSLQKKFILGGIHLTESSRTKNNIVSHSKKEHSLSASFHRLDELGKQGALFDYVFLSPVFDSISKKGYKTDFDSAELQKLLIKHKNVIALGGITPSTLVKIEKLGFAGAAALGYIWESKEPVKAFLRLQSKIK